MMVLGLSNMRDAAAALVSDGRIVAAAEEERFVRRKHVTALPVQAMCYCLHEAGVALRDVEAIAVPWKYWQVGRRARLALTAMIRSPQLFRVKGTRSLERVSREWLELFRLREELTRRVDAGVIQPVFLDHHVCHAASSFLVSPFERSAILVVDGASEADTTLLAIGEGSRITVLDRTPLPHSLGQFYAAMTAFLGFRPDQDEYIVMGLASSGEPTFAPALRQNIVRLLSRGRFEVNVRLLDFHLARAGFFVEGFVRLLPVPRWFWRKRCCISAATCAPSRRLSRFVWQAGLPITVWPMGGCAPNSGLRRSMCRRPQAIRVRRLGRPCGGRRGVKERREGVACPMRIWGHNSMKLLVGQRCRKQACWPSP